MYDLLDRPVRDLPAFEKGLLDAIRRWVHAFTLAGAPAVAGAAPFDTAMKALADGTVETLVIQRPCYPTVEETEATLLGLWRLVRAGRLAAARAGAELLMDPGHSREMVRAMQGAIAA